MILNLAEKHSRLWQKLDKRTLKRIADLHVMLEHNVEHDKACAIRGQIKELRILERMGKEGLESSQPPLEMATAHDVFN